MSRPAAYAIVAALFLAGVAIGALGTYVIVERRAVPAAIGPFSDPESAADELARLLDLSPVQRDQAASILRDRWREAGRVRLELRSGVDRHLAESERLLGAVLDPAQRKRLEALVRERRIGIDRLFLGPHP